jgi:hypothetical protein
MMVHAKRMPANGNGWLRDLTPAQLLNVLFVTSGDGSRRLFPARL